jgi:hypothetical protein
MVDKSATERAAITAVFPQAHLLLCDFHRLQVDIVFGMKASLRCLTSCILLTMCGRLAVCAFGTIRIDN